MFKKLIGRLFTSTADSSKDASASNAVPSVNAAPSVDAAEFSYNVSQGDRYRDTGRPEKAVDFYKQALAIQPNATDIRVQLGNMAKDSGQQGLALSCYEQALAEYTLAAAQLAGRAKSQNDAAILDVHIQLGHLFKMMHEPYKAIHHFKLAAAADPRPDLLHEIRSLEVTAVDFALTGKNDLAAQSGRDRRTAAHSMTTEDLLEREIDPDDYISDQYTCLCESRHFIDSGNSTITCRSCGSVHSLFAAYLQRNATLVRLPPKKLGSADIAEITAAAGIILEGKAVAVVGAEFDGTQPESITILAVSSAGLIDRGLARLSFDVIIVPDASHGITHVASLIDDCYKLLRPSGRIVVGYRSSTAFPETAQPKPDDTVQPPVFHWFADTIFTRLFELRPDRGDIGRQFVLGKYNWVVASKVATMSMGVMSGIGDASWSFLFAEAVAKSYGLEKFALHIHDSGDFRRNRSNNMLARFSFVDELARSRFDIHATPPMDEVTGHIRYIPSGPVPLSSADQFDYRLVFNTYFEQGWSVEQICARYDIPVTDVNYSFFEKYQEQPNDLRGLRRVRHYTGNDYIVFHFGATKDNTEVGLNRGGIWSQQDWIALGRKLHAKYGVPIVVIGAAYDHDYANQIMRETSDVFYYDTIGQMDITETLAIIRRARFIVSFPSGVGIVGPYLRVPTVIFWRKKDNSYHPLHDRAGFDPAFSRNWVPPEQLNEKLYYDAFYGTDTPDTIYDMIVRENWWDRSPAVSRRVD